MKRARATTASSNCCPEPGTSLGDSSMESSSQTPSKTDRRGIKPAVGVVDQQQTKRNEGREPLANGNEEERESLAGTTDTSTLESGIDHGDQVEVLSTASTRIPPCILTSHPHFRDALLSASYLPPCTIDTLRELDLHAIQQNVNLRIDLGYDHDLFFQPISGRKGEAKRVESEKYWLSLDAEFRIYFHNTRPSCVDCSTAPAVPTIRFNPRLPLMFTNLREIVEMLVPEAEHDEVASRLDVDFLMQQVRHGALDIVALSEWLATLLTLHCAPKRDELAEEFTQDIRVGAEQADPTRIVTGLEKLFNLLESMKLDVANHQIRSFRLALIDDSVPFQQDCFSKAIASGTFEISRSQRWFRQARAVHESSCTSDIGDEKNPGFRTLIHGLVRLCNPAIKRIPNTLQYDYHRIIRLQEDLQDLVQIELCLQVFEQRVLDFNNAVPRAQITAMHELLKSRIIALTEDEDGNGGAISDHLDAISIELTRAAFLLATLTTGHARESKAQSSIDEFEFERTNKTLYEYFQAEDDEENLLSSTLSTMEGLTMDYAQQFLSLSALELSNRQRHWTLARNKADPKSNVVLASWEDMARRLAHIGVVHWQVWAEICYLKADDIEATADLFSPISVYGDERFYGDEIGDLYSPSISSPLSSQQPFTDAEFPKSMAAMQQITVPRKENGLRESSMVEFVEDGTTMGGHVIDLDQDFDLDSGKGASAHIRKDNARRKSL